MQKNRLMGIGLIAATAGALGLSGAFAAGCSSDDSNGGTGTTSDGGPGGNADGSVVTLDGAADGSSGDGATGPLADGGGDSAADTGPVDAGPPNAKLVFVHGSPDLPAVQFCFALNSTPDGTPGKVAAVAPLPSTPLQRGTATVLKDLGVDLAGLQVTTYAIFGAPTKTCDQLVGATGSAALDAAAAIKLGSVPSSSFLKGGTYVVTLAGCLPGNADPTATASYCGAAWTDQTGNLTTTIDKADTTTAVAAGSLGAQFAQRSPGVQRFTTGAQAGVAAGFLVTTTSDAGSDAASDAATAVTQVLPITTVAETIASPLSTLAAVPGVDPTTAEIGVFAPSADGGALDPRPTTLGGNLLYSAKLTDLARLAQAGGGTAFTAGSAYTLLLIGDPVAADAGAPGRGAQIVAIPNVPSVPAQ